MNLFKEREKGTLFGGTQKASGQASHERSNDLNALKTCFPIKKYKKNRGNSN